MNIIWMIIFFLCQVRCWEWIFFEYELPNIEYEGVKETMIAITKKAEEDELRRRLEKEQKHKDKAMRKLIKKSEKKMKNCWKLDMHPCYPNYPVPVPNCPPQALPQQTLPQMSMTGHPAMHPGFTGYTGPVACNSFVGHPPPVPVNPQQIPQHPGPMPANPPNNAIPNNHPQISQQQGAVPVCHPQMSHATAPLPGYLPQTPYNPVSCNYPQVHHAVNHAISRQQASAPPLELLYQAPPPQIPQNPVPVFPQVPCSPALSPGPNNHPSHNGNKPEQTPPVPKPRGINKSPAPACP